MSEQVEVTALLTQLIEAGQHDSTGSFRVDLRRAVARLSDFRHRDQAMFLRHLLSAAVMLQAGKLVVQFGMSGWKLAMEGNCLTFDEICQIFPSLSTPIPGSRGQALRELALALTNLLGPDLKVQLTSGTAQLSMNPRQLKVSPQHGRSSCDGVEILVRGLNWWERLLMPGLSADKWVPRPLSPPDLTPLIKACRYAPLAVEVNGKVESLFNWDSLASLRLEGRSALPQIPIEGIVLHETHAQEISILLGLYPEGEGNAVIFCRGMLFELLPRWPLPCCTLMVDNSLNRDLLGLKLVEDALLLRAWQTAEEKVLSLVAAMLKHDEFPRQRLITDLVTAWRFQKLKGPWLSLPFVQLGGWEQPTSPRELNETYQSEGYISLDPAQTDPQILKILTDLYPDLIQLSPYWSLQPLTDNDKWLIRVPSATAELRYRDRWPGPEASLWRAGISEYHPQLARLPAGLEIHLRDGVENADLVALTDSLAAPLLVGLANSRRLLGSAPALQLALWLARRQAGTRLNSQFVMRRLGEGAEVPLHSILGSRVSYALEGMAPSVFDRTLEPVLLLSPAELELLRPVVQGTKAIGGWSLGREQATTLGDLAAQLVAGATGVLGVGAACFLLYNPKRNRFEVVAETNMFDFRPDVLLDKDRVLSAALRQQLAEGPPIRSSLMHPPQSNAMDMQKVRLYLSGVMCWRGREGVLLVQRSFREGTFTARHQELLAHIMRAAVPALERLKEVDR